MDFGIGFLSNNVMLPILDFFYGKFPSYGLAIVALTLVIRIALFPVNANQLRNMRNMKIANPIMQKRIKEVQERYKGDPAKQQQEMGKVNSENFKEFGNPLAGCLPAVLQMPILFALFATLRGSPFSDINYAVNFQVSPTQVESQAYISPPQNIYFADRVHYPVQASVSNGTNLVVGAQTQVALQAIEGTKIESFADVSSKFPEIDLSRKWTVTKGEDVVSVAPDGTVTALKSGEATVQATIPGLAANKGFLFIKALGEVGVSNPDGTFKLDILAMILAFGISLYINQNISGAKTKSSTSADSQQQDTMNRVTPVIFSGMFLFFPLPAGVLLYMLVANVFQTIQAFIVSKESLPENLQKLAVVDVVSTPEAIAPTNSKPAKLPFKPEPKASKDKDEISLPFEPGSSKKKKS